MRKNFRVAIVEDEAVYIDALKEMLARYEKEKEVEFAISVYNYTETFLFEYKNCFDIVFMDIELPGMNGMDGARRLREIDSLVVLIFITNMAQFAVQGYEVDALDYILKPVLYKNFSIKLDKALNCINNRAEKQVVVYGKNGTNRMSISDIFYVEVRGHHLIFHLSGNKEVDVCGALSKLEVELKDYGFSRCNSYLLVNMKYVTEINATSVILIDGTDLQISKRRRQAFLDEFAVYVGKMGGHKNK